MAASDDLLNQWKQEQQVTAVPVGDKPTNTSGSDALLSQWKNDLESNITISIQNAAKGNPERAAEVQKIARSLYVPTDTVEKNWDDLNAFAKTRVFQMQRDAAEDPVLARMYANPDFAAIGYDDYSNIAGAGKAVRNLGKPAERTVVETLQDIGVTGLKGAMGLNQTIIGLLDIPTKGWVGKQIQGLGLDFKEAQDIAQSMYSPATQQAAQRFAQADGVIDKAAAAIENPSVIATTVGESLPSMFLGGAFAKSLGALRGLAASPLTRVGIGEGAVTAGQIAEQVRSENPSGELTTGQVMAALAAGGGTGLLGMLGAKVAQRLGITDLEAYVAGVNTANPAKQKMLGRQILEGAAAEGVLEELPQSIQEQMWQNIAQEKPVFDGVDDAAVLGLFAGMAMGGGGPIVAYPANIRAEREAARMAEQKAQVMDLIAGHAAASEVLRRDPESFQNYIEQVSEAGDIQSVFIKASVLQQLGLTEAISEVIPSVGEQLRQAVSPDQEVQISVADYAAKIATTEANAALLDNIRVEGESMTRAEATAFIENESETLQKAYDKSQKTQQTFDEFKKSSKAVESEVLGQLNQIGAFAKADNKVQASLYSKIFSMLALRLNQTPEQVYQQYKTTIMAESQAQTGQVLNQATQILTATPEFQNWFGDSKAVDAEGKPVVLYHGRGEDFKEFNTEGGKGKTFGTGAFFTSSPAVANTYASGTSRNVAPVYLSLKTPVVIDAGGANWSSLGKGVKINLPAAVVSDQQDENLLAELEGREPKAGATKKLKAKSTTLGKLLPNEFQYGDETFSTDDLARWARSQGYDGIVIKNVVDQGPAGRFVSEESAKPSEIYVAFKPNQIKSIFNKGSWSPETNNILRQSGNNYKGVNNAEWTLDQNLTDAAKKYFGITSRPLEAGYILPDGTMLDFTGRHETSKDNWKYMQDQRSVDHRMLFGENMDGFSMEDMLESTNGNQAMHEFMARTGAMRVDFRAGVVSIMRPPSDAQMNVASRNIGREFAAASYIDAENGRIIADTEWDKVSGSKLKNFFAENRDKKPEAGAPLFQKNEDATRGYIDPKNLMVILTPEADRSTPGHELAHAVVEIYTRIANTENAPAEIVSDLDKLLEFAGVQGATQQERLAGWSAMTLDEQRPFHEAIAYNWEIYLAEGKAPSVELQSVFDRLSQWIRDLYVVVRDKLNDVYKAEFGKDLPVMEDGVREVFDRMLASQEQIAQAETVRNMQVLFESKPEGMDDAQWAALQQMAEEARDASISKLTQDSLRQMRWLSNAKMRVIKQMQRENAALRAEVQQGVEAEIKKSAIYKAINFIKDGIEVLPDGTTRETAGLHKISIAGLEDLYMGEGDRYALLDWSQLPKNMYGTEGLHPDALAEQLGFGSGDELIRTLIATPSFKEAVRAETDARMLAEYGDMNDKREVDLAVERALHNEARARFVAAQLRFVSRATAPARAMIQAAKRAAQNIIGDKLIKDLKPSEYGIAEARANKEAIAAQKAGDDQAVTKAMQSALVNNQLAEVAADTRSQIDSDLAYLRNVTSDANRKRIGADYADQIDSMLARFDLSAPGNRIKTLAQWLESQREAGYDPEIAQEILDEAYRKPYKLLTVKEFRDLLDAVRQIEHLGRNEQNMLTAAKETAYKAARDEIVESVGVNARGRTADVRTAKTKIGKMVQGLQRFMAEHIKAATIARILDGGKEGPVWEYLIRPANAAADRETAMRAEATLDITRIMAPILNGMKPGKGTLVPSIGRALNKEERVAIALNMGNQSNMQRLLDGEGWTIQQVMPVLESLTAAELEAVQQIWDYSETKHKPLIAEQWRRLYGREPNWIDPTPLTVKSADGKTVELRGGYYPVVYDPRASQRAGELYDAEQARMEMQGFISATISTSFAKGRVQMVKERPLLLSLTGVYNGINEVIHALAWQEFIIDANRLLRSYSIDQAIRTTYGPEYKSQLKGWVKDVAVGERAAAEGGAQAINFVRQSVSAAGLGFNIMSALQQVTGFSSSIVKIGAGYVGRGIAKTMASPSAAIKEVYGKSTFMANRGRTQFRELNELRNMVQGETKVARGVKVGAYFMMAQMQRMVDIPTWIGAYEKAIGEGNDEDRAIALADQSVIDSQGGGMLKDLSKIERGGPWLKLFTVFYSYMGTQFNLATAEAMTERSKGKLAAKMLMLTVVPVVLAYAIKHGLTPDDDDEWDWEKISKDLITENISYLMGMMILVRELGSAAKIAVGTEGGNRGYSGPAGVRMISDLYSFATQAKQGDFDDAFRKAAINLLGDFTGLPSAQINRTINGVDALIEGKTSNPAAVLTGFEKK